MGSIPILFCPVKAVNGFRRVTGYVVDMVHIFLRRIAHEIPLRQPVRRDPESARLKQLLRVFRTKKLRQFLANPLGAYGFQIARKFLHCFLRRGLDREAELGREPHRPKNPKRILRESLGRVADRPDDARLQVLHAVEQIDQTGAFVISHRVDCKIAPEQILPEIPRECDRIRMAKILVSSVNPVGGNLIALLPAHDGYRAVFDSGIDRPRKEALHLLRQRRSRDVPVLRNPVKERITNTPADGVGFKAGRFECPDDPFHIFRQCYGKCHAAPPKNKKSGDEQASPVLLNSTIQRSPCQGARCPSRTPQSYGRN